MNKILLLFIMFFVCLTQGGIAFSESETLNNTSAATIITAEHGIKPYDEDQTTLLLKDIRVEQYQKTYFYDTFDKVVDSKGHPISPNRINYVYIDGKLSDSGQINTDTIGEKHTVAITYYDDFGNAYYSNKVAVTVIPMDDKSSIRIKDATIFLGHQWNPEDIFVEARNRFGDPITWKQAKEELGAFVRVNDNPLAEIDTSKPGKYEVEVRMKGARGWFNVLSNKANVTVKKKEDEDKDKDKGILKVKNSTLYVGQKWEPKDNFVSATDEDGNSFHWGDYKKLKYSGNVDTSKPGVYKVKYYFYVNDKKKIVSECEVTVKEDKTSIKAKDSTLNVGQKWEPKDNFVSATDEEGREVPFSDSRITISPGKIDTSKPGVHKIKYTFHGVVKNVHSEFKVTVKEDKTSIKTKDSILYVGQKWKPIDNFVSATDEEGREVPFSDQRITIPPGKIDT
ncbi:bacterial Ig-like domain-containing protein, partial [Enterococcus faecalis]|uniref:bacterial Ig-like domain-containing protein n=1 Tax=Enterococcus faecalis TaxID=1351 RepID=UPI00163B01EF